MEAVQHFFQTLARMNWSDYLDIIVVAFLIYSILPHIKTPSMMKIVRMVVALVLITWVTDVMELYTINWILNQLLAIGLVAFVVLFQPELRKLVFLVVGTKWFGSKKPIRDMERVIEETVSACELMSLGKDKYNEKKSSKKKGTEVPQKKAEKDDLVGAVAMFKDAKSMQAWFDQGESFEKILNRENVYNYLFLDKKKGDDKLADPLKNGHVGALIVFERSNPLLEWSDAGTPMDCLINQKTLCSVFYPINPLHDAAAIVRNGRIAAACCKLPLTKNNEYTEKYGTRHCAAVGISEVTDAIAVVVSEESGKISFAKEGKLYTLDDLATTEKSRDALLKEFLGNALLPKEDGDKTIVEQLKKWGASFNKEAQN